LAIQVKNIEIFSKKHILYKMVSFSKVNELCSKHPEPSKNGYFKGHNISVASHLSTFLQDVPENQNSLTKTWDSWSEEEKNEFDPLSQSFSTGIDVKKPEKDVTLPKPGEQKSTGEKSSSKTFTVRREKKVTEPFWREFDPLSENKSKSKTFSMRREKREIQPSYPLSENLPKMEVTVTIKNESENKTR
jgi:hypothetical protein